MGHQWDAEQLLEPPQALHLIQEQFPELEAKNIRLLGAGWDNSAFIVDDHLIFRFPRREIALPLLEAEWSLLPRLAPRLPLPIPHPKWKGAPSEHFPWPFVGYEMLPGFTACYANLSEEQREALAEPLAQFLVSLHGTPQSEIASCFIPGNNFGRIDKTVIIPKLKQNLEELSLLGLLENRKEMEGILEEAKHLRPPLLSTVVHGDLYVRHLLVNETHQLVGVIDWGDVHFGDPAIDLAIAHSFLPKSAHPIFRKAYGEISEETWVLARLRALYNSSLLLLFGHHSQDPALVREGLRSLKLITRGNCKTPETTFFIF